MNAPWSVVAGFVLVPACLALPVPALAEIKVALEVTQGIQYFEHSVEGTNTIDLVAGRATAVRARVTDLPPGKTVAKVKGTLTVTGTPPREFTAENPGVVNLGSRDRGDTNSTLNFKVPGLVKGSYDFKATVDIEFAEGGTDSATGTALGLKVIDVRPFEIRLVPMIFETDDETYGPPDTDSLGPAIELLRACFPLEDDAVITWEPNQKLPTADRGCEGRIDNRGGRRSDVNEVLDALGAMVVSTVRAGTVPPDLVYYGFAKPAVGRSSIISNKRPCSLDYYGWSSCAAKAGFGTADPDFAPKNFSHEFGHLVGLDHCIGCGGTSRPCDVKEIGFDVAAMSARPSGDMSFMQCGPPLPGIWMTPEDYKYCLEVLKVDPTKPPCSSTDPQPDPPAQWSLVVRGAVTPSGDGIAWLAPVFRYPWKATATPSSGLYQITAKGGSHTVTRKFDPFLRLEPLAGGSGFEPGFFSVVLPFPEKPEGKEIVNVDTLTIRKGTAVLFTMTRTQIPPEISIATQQPLSNPLNQPVTLQWTVADADTPAANLLHQVVYSHDNGQSFHPVAVNLNTGMAVFDPAPFLESGPNQGLLRILVTDGLNTVFKDITSLTVP